MTRHELTERIAGNRLSIRRYRAESATVVDYLENGGQVELTEGTYPTLYAVNLKPGNSRTCSVDEIEEEDFAYECPTCGEGHDGMTTGTELCESCQMDADNPEEEEEEE